MKHRLLLLLSATVLLSGCSFYTVRYDSYPQSARVICNGALVGETPYEQIIELDENASARGYFPIGNCHAQWVSGATAAYPTSIVPNSSGKTAMVVNRPQHSGLEADLFYEAERRKAAIAAERLRLEEERLRLERQRQHEMEKARRDHERHMAEQARHKEPKRVEPKRMEPKRAEPKHVEPKHEAPKQPVAKPMALKQPAAKPSTLKQPMAKPAAPKQPMTKPAVHKQPAAKSTGPKQVAPTPEKPPRQDPK